MNYIEARTDHELRGVIEMGESAAKEFTLTAKLSISCKEWKRLLLARVCNAWP